MMDEAGEGRERGTETKENPHVERKEDGGPLAARPCAARISRWLQARPVPRPASDDEGRGEGDRLKNGGGGGAGRSVLMGTRRRPDEFPACKPRRPD